MKILLVKLSSLGDILHLFPAVSDLRRHFPDGEIHWLVETPFAEVVGWQSAIDKVIPVPLRAHKKIWWKIPALLRKLRQQLQAEKYDYVIDAQGLLKSAILARLAGSPTFGFAFGSARESMAVWLYQKTTKIPEGLHIIEKNRRLIANIFSFGIDQPADFGLNVFRQKYMQAGLPSTLKINIGQTYIVMLHGTTWNSKYWPENSWKELISLFARQGLNCLIPWGNEMELERAHRLQVAGGKYAQVLPKISLTEMMNVLLHSMGFISVESGIGHLAAALDIPGIMLHGPTDPAYSGILGKECEHLTSGIACSPCFRRDCPILNEEGTPPCQRIITPHQVYLKFKSSIPEYVEDATKLIK
jgi:heptosyltransferase-1